jgi:hypothetical protein
MFSTGLQNSIRGFDSALHRQQWNGFDCANLSVFELQVGREWSRKFSRAPQFSPWESGRLYGVTGRTADARHQLEEAARRGDKTVRERANAALAALPRRR